MATVMEANGHGIIVPARMRELRFAEAPTKPTGDAGLGISGGIIFESDLPAHFRGREWNRIVRSMLLSPVVKGMLFAVEMLIRQADWRVEPADGEDIDPGEAQRIADFVTSCMEDMRTPWKDTLAMILSFLPYGYSLFEIVYKRRLGMTGDQPSEQTDGLIGWDEWGPRSQDTVTKWVFDDAGHAIAFTQQTPSRPAPVEIPLNRCLHFRAGGYHGSPEGESVLRSAYTDWDAIRKLQMIESIGMERDLAGIPVFGAPPRIMSPDRTAEEEAVYNALKAIVTGIRNNDQAGVIYPLEYDQSGKPRYEFKLLSAGGARQFDTSKVIDRRKVQMTMCLLADFMNLGHGATGSYALAKDKTQLFEVAIAAWLSTIANTITDQAIRPLLMVNGMDTRMTPTLHGIPTDSSDLNQTSAFFTAVWPMVQTLAKADQVAIAEYVLGMADWPAPVHTLEELEQEPEEEGDADLDAAIQAIMDTLPALPDGVEGMSLAEPVRQQFLEAGLALAALAGRSDAT